jgi:hypothetical protein
MSDALPPDVSIAAFPPLFTDAKGFKFLEDMQQEWMRRLTGNLSAEDIAKDEAAAKARIIREREAACVKCCDRSDISWDPKTGFEFDTGSDYIEGILFCPFCGTRAQRISQDQP